MYRAATAVARQWLLCMPPIVITQSAPCSFASASKNSSFLTLLPLSCIPVKSSLCNDPEQPALSYLTPHLDHLPHITQVLPMQLGEALGFSYICNELCHRSS
jgi:hypothetical protein